MGRGKGGSNKHSVCCVATYNLCMTQEAQELLQKALALPENERAELAGNLISSLDAIVDPEVDAAWQQEVVRRLDEVQSGEVRSEERGEGKGGGGGGGSGRKRDRRSRRET